MFAAATVTADATAAGVPTAAKLFGVAFGFWQFFFFWLMIVQIVYVCV